MSIEINLPVRLDPEEIACCDDDKVLELILGIDFTIADGEFTETLIKRLCERIRLDLNPDEYLALIKELEEIA
jgi:hypothetical protein